MKDVMELQGELVGSRKGLMDRYGLSTTTITRWKERGLLGEPIHIGRTVFYRLAVIEANMLSNAAAADLGDHLFTSNEAGVEALSLTASPTGHE